MLIRILVFIVFICVFGPNQNQCFAQSLYVVDVENTQNDYSLDDISRITFSEGKMHIRKKDQSSIPLPLASIRYLSFKDFTVTNYPSPLFKDINVYPNPVYDVFILDLTKQIFAEASVNILNLSGSLLKKQVISSPGKVSIDVKALPGGTYLCQLRIDKKMHAIKIIKQ